MKTETKTPTPAQRLYSRLRHAHGIHSSKDGEIFIDEQEDGRLKYYVAQDVRMKIAQGEVEDIETHDFESDEIAIPCDPEF